MATLQTPSGHTLPNFTGDLIDSGQIKLLSVIGCGTFGVVYSAVDLKSPPFAPFYYAIKCQKRAIEAKSRKCQRREIALHHLASPHPNIVTLHRVVSRGNYLFLVLDYCPESDLFWTLKGNNPFLNGRNPYENNTILLRDVLVQLIDVVDFLHGMGIYHRDLKPENILCVDSGKRLVLTDFGLATSDQSSTEFQCGSSHYMSPECLKMLYTRVRTISHKHNDIWSLGMIFVNLICARNPWTLASVADPLFGAYLRDPRVLRQTLDISRETERILRTIFQLNPSHRCTLANLRGTVLRVQAFTPSAPIAPLPVSMASHNSTVSLESIPSADITALRDHHHGHRGPSLQDEGTFVSYDLVDDYWLRDSSGQSPTVFERFADTPMDHLPPRSASRCSSISSAPDSEGPATPEMPAFDPAAVAAVEDPLDSDELNIGEPSQVTSMAKMQSFMQPRKRDGVAGVKKKEATPRRLLTRALRKIGVFS